MPFFHIIRLSPFLTVCIAAILGLAVVATSPTESHAADGISTAFLKPNAERENFIKSLPPHLQPKYHRLYGQQKPGHECFFTGKEYHVPWDRLCLYNHAFDWEKVSMFGEYDKRSDASKAVDGLLDTGMAGKSTNDLNGIAWWEISLAKAVNAAAFVVVSADGLTGGVLAVSETVKGDALMTDRSGKVKRFYLGKNGQTFKVDLDGKPARHFRLYTHTATWRKEKNVPPERFADNNNTPAYIIHEVYILGKIPTSNLRRR